MHNSFMSLAGGHLNGVLVKSPGSYKALVLPSFARISILFGPFTEFITIAKTAPMFCMHKLTAISVTLTYNII